MNRKVVPLSHPGHLLRDQILPALDLSVSQAARELRVCRQTLHRILAGTAAITPDMAARLGRFSGLPAQQWLASQQAYDLRRAEQTLAAVLDQIPCHVPPPALRQVLIRHVEGT